MSAHDRRRGDRPQGVEEQDDPLRKALEKIAEARGSYGRDKYTRNSNTIESMRFIAIAALRSSRGDLEPLDETDPWGETGPRGGIVRAREGAA